MITEKDVIELVWSKWDWNLSYNMISLEETTRNHARPYYGGVRGAVTARIVEWKVCDYIREILEAEPEYDNTNTEFDLTVNGIRIDIKTVLQEIPFVSLEYQSSLPSYHPEQQTNCDGYIFTRANVGLSKLWILGWIPKHKFLREAIFHKQGEVIKVNEYDDFEFKQNTFSVKHKNLFPINTLPSYDINERYSNT